MSDALCAAVVGVFFAFQADRPARVVSKKSPMEALRYE